MARWIDAIQGIVQVLTSTDVALARRRILKFGSGLTVADDGTKLVASLGAPDAALAAALATLLRGGGLTVDAAGDLATRVRPRRKQMRDDFCSGATAAAAVVGTIGELGWTLTGVGTPNFTRGVSGDLSTPKGTLGTSGANNDQSALTLGATATQAVAKLSEIETLQAVQTQTLATTRYFFGMMGDFTQSPIAATNCVGLLYDSAVSPNWQFIARIAGVGSPSVSGSAASANRELITMYQATLGSVRFDIGGTTIGTISSGLPTANMNIGYQLTTLSAATRSVALGHFSMNANLTVAPTPFDDDLLEA